MVQTEAKRLDIKLKLMMGGRVGVWKEPDKQDFKSLNSTYIKSEQITKIYSFQQLYRLDHFAREISPRLF